MGIHFSACSQSVRVAVLLPLVLATGAVAYIAMSRPLADLELAQLVAFPILLAAAWQLPKNSSARAPKFLVGFATFMWILSSLHIRGHLPFSLNHSDIFLAELARDDNEQAARDLMSRYRFIARVYSLPGMTPVRRRFASAEEASDWLFQQNGANVLVYGNPEWPSLALQANFSALYAERPSRSPESQNRFLELASEHGLDPKRDFFTVSDPGIELPLAVIQSPRTVTISADMPEIIHHFLGWTARGLSQLPKSDPALERLRKESGGGSAQCRDERRALQLDAFSEASNVFGNWRSPTALSLARFFGGTLQLLQALDEDGVDRGELMESSRLLHLSLKRVRKIEEPELASAALNNLGVMQYFWARDEDGVKKARASWLRAVTVLNGKKPPPGARAAMLNLDMLEYRGIR